MNGSDLTGRTAAEILEAVFATRGLASWLSWQGLEAPAPDEILLHGPRLRLPGGAGELAARRARLARVDRAALAEGSALALREVVLEGVDLAALFPGPLPFPRDQLPPELDARLQVEPAAPEGADQRVRLAFEWPGALALELALDFAGPFEAAQPLRLGAARLRLANRGLAARLREGLVQAAGSAEEARAGLRVMAAGLLFQPGPRSPLAAPLLDLLPGMFDRAAEPFEAILALRSAQPALAESWGAALRGQAPLPLAIEAGFAGEAPERAAAAP